MNKAERNASIEEYGRGWELFTAALDDVPREAWRFRPVPTEWSIHAIIVHMSDSEAIGALRLRKIIAEPGAVLMTYDEARWGEALHYEGQSEADALNLFRLTRQTTYHLLKALPDEVFAHSGVHPEVVYPEYGEAYTLEKWLRIYTRHVRDHISQLKKNHGLWREQNR